MVLCSFGHAPFVGENYFSDIRQTRFVDGIGSVVKGEDDKIGWGLLDRLDLDCGGQEGRELFYEPPGDRGGQGRSLTLGGITELEGYQGSVIHLLWLSYFQFYHVLG